MDRKGMTFEVAVAIATFCVAAWLLFLWSVGA